MKAAHYSSKGPARDVLVVGEQPDPAPQVGEVLVRIAHENWNWAEWTGEADTVLTL